MNDVSPPEATLLLVKLHLRQGAGTRFGAWQANALTRAAATDGFLSSEVAPAADASGEWTLRLRFRTRSAAESWVKSDAWQDLCREAQELLAENSEVDAQICDSDHERGVVEVIVTRIKPGREQAYRDWEARIQQAQAKFPGYLGSYVQPPIAGELGWTSLMRFESAGELDAWLKSSERAALLREVQPLIDYAHLQRVDTSFPGWFPTDGATGKGPPNWKAAMLVLLGLFPIVMLEARFLSPQLAGLNSSLAMFIGNVISVALTTWATMPLFIAAFKWWLFPRPGIAALRVHLAGTALIWALFAVEVAALWRLL